MRKGRMPPDATVQDEKKILQADHDIQFAFAVLARAEPISDLAEANGPAAGGEQIHQDLEALRLAGH